MNREGHTAAAICFGVVVAVVWISALLWQTIFRPFPVPPGADQTFVLEFTSRGRATELISWRDFLELRRTAGSLVSAEGVPLLNTTLEIGGSTRVVNARAVADDYLMSLGHTPHLGRDIVRGDEETLRVVALISYTLWRSLDGSPDLVGRAIRLNNHVVDVVGVAPEGFGGTQLQVREDVWVSLPAAHELTSWKKEQLFDETTGGTQGGFRWLRALLRTAESPQHLETRLSSSQSGVKLVPVAMAAYPASARLSIDRLLRLFALAAAAMMLAGGFNVAGLGFIRGLGRRHSLQIHRMLGASRAAIARMVLVDTVRLTARGVAVALLVGASLLWALRSLQLPGGVSGERVVLRPEPQTMGVSIATLIVLGIVWATAVSIGQTAHAERPTLVGEGRSFRRVHLAMLTPQVAAAILLIATAALLLNDMRRVLSDALNFNHRVVFMTLESERFAALPPELQRLTATQISRTLGATPGITSAALGRTMFGSDIGQTGWRLRVNGESHTLSRPFLLRSIGPGYLEILAVPVLAGRVINEGDTASAPPVAVISESVAGLLSEPPRSLLGRAIGLSQGRVEVVGIVRDVVRESAGARPRPTIFVPAMQAPADAPMLLDYVVASDLPVHEVVARVQPSLNALVPDARVSNVRTPEQHIDREFSDSILAGVAGAILGGLVVLLALYGIHASVTVMVRQRQKEIGIRTAVGASPASLRALFARQSIMATVAGVAVALLTYPLVQQLLAGMLKGQQDLQLLMPLVAALLVGALVAVVGLRAADGAAKVDPASLLRQV